MDDDEASQIESERYQALFRQHKIFQNNGFKLAQPKQKPDPNAETGKIFRKHKLTSKSHNHNKKHEQHY